MLQEFFEEYLTETEMADALNVSARTLQRWRRQKRGPAYTRKGKTVLYPRDGIAAWLKINEVEPGAGKRRTRRAA